MLSVQEIRKTIRLAIPEGTVVTAHNEDGHFYKIIDDYVRSLPDVESVTYPSVTAKLQVLKDPSIANFKMNRALDYVFKNFSQMTAENLMEHLSEAKKEGTHIFEDAGNIGNTIHDARENYFNEWIRTGKRPGNSLDFLPQEKYDIRAVSALAALDKFIEEYNYRPAVCELFVYSHKWKTAGTLDDIGIIDWPYKGGTRPVLILLDVKTSNQFKYHYFFQTAMYYFMFKKLVPDLKIKKVIILKLSKENRTYQIEDLQSPSQIATYARSMIRTSEAIEIIKGRRKDNQKRVLKI